MKVKLPFRFYDFVEEQNFLSWRGAHTRVPHFDLRAVEDQSYDDEEDAKKLVL